MFAPGLISSGFSIHASRRLGRYSAAPGGQRGAGSKKRQVGPMYPSDSPDSVTVVHGCRQKNFRARLTQNCISRRSLAHPAPQAARFPLRETFRRIDERSKAHFAMRQTAETRLIVRDTFRAHVAKKVSLVDLAGHHRFRLPPSLRDPEKETR